MKLLLFAAALNVALVALTSAVAIASEAETETNVAAADQIITDEEQKIEQLLGKLQKIDIVLEKANKIDEILSKAQQIDQLLKTTERIVRLSAQYGNNRYSRPNRDNRDDNDNDYINYNFDPNYAAKYKNRDFFDKTYQKPYDLAKAIRIVNENRDNDDDDNDDDDNDRFRGKSARPEDNRQRQRFFDDDDDDDDRLRNFSPFDSVMSINRLVDKIADKFASRLSRMPKFSNKNY